MTSYKARSKESYFRRDHYQEMTDRVIAALEAGAPPWRKPWNPDVAGGAAMPVNAATGRRYRGINVLTLAMSKLAFSSEDPRWTTCKQASARGWQIRGGERGTTVFFFKQLQLGDDRASDSTDERGKRIPVMRTFTVFHASQIDGIPAFTPPKATQPIAERIDSVEAIVRNSGAVIRIGGDLAFYSPATDHIQMPLDVAFHSTEDRASTLLHECGHWSGAKDRLNRDLTGRFGSALYAKEEARAEFSSLMVGGVLGLPTDIQNHASYLASWIEVLKNDKRELFHAAADAQKIADYLLAFHPDYASFGEPPDEPASDEAGENLADAA